MPSSKKYLKDVFPVPAEVKICLRSFVTLCILVGVSTLTRSAAAVAEKSRRRPTTELLRSTNIFLAADSGINSLDSPCCQIVAFFSRLH